MGDAGQSRLCKRTCGRSFLGVRTFSVRVPAPAVVACSSLSRPRTCPAASSPLPARPFPSRTRAPSACPTRELVRTSSPFGPGEPAGLSPRRRTEVAVQTEELGGVLPPQGLAGTATRRLLSRAGHRSTRFPELPDPREGLGCEARRGLGERTKPAGPCDWSPAALHPLPVRRPWPQVAGTGWGTANARARAR